MRSTSTCVRWTCVFLAKYHDSAHVCLLYMYHSTVYYMRWTCVAIYVYTSLYKIIGFM